VTFIIDASMHPPEGSWTGGCRNRCEAIWPSMPWSRRCTGVPTPSSWCTTATGGVQSLSIRYTDRFREAEIESSVGSVKHLYDKALAGTITGLYKTEVIRWLGTWRNVEDVEFETLDWVDWPNNRRLLEPIGYVPPAEFDELYYIKGRRPWPSWPGLCGKPSGEAGAVKIVL